MLTITAMIAAGVIGALAVAGYFGLRRNREEIERVRKQQRISNFILFSVFLLVIAGIVIVVYFVSNNTPSDSYASILRGYVKSLFNLESGKWDNWTIFFIVMLLYIILFFFGLIIVCRESSSPQPYIHIGDNNCCSIVAKLSVGAAAITIIIALVVLAIYRNLHL